MVNSWIDSIDKKVQLIQLCQLKDVYQLNQLYQLCQSNLMNGKQLDWLDWQDYSIDTIVPIELYDCQGYEEVQLTRLIKIHDELTGLTDGSIVKDLYDLLCSIDWIEKNVNTDNSAILHHTPAILE